MVSDQMMSQMGTRPFIHIEPHLCARSPFLPTPFNAIHVDHIGDSVEAKQGSKDGSVIAKRQYQPLFIASMQRGLPVEQNGTHRTFSLYRNMYAPDTFPRVLVSIAASVILAIDGHRPPGFHQIERQ